MPGHVARIHRVHLLRAAPRREHGQDARAAPDVQDNFTLDLRPVRLDGVEVGTRPRGVSDHLAMDAEVRVGIEVGVVRVRVAASGVELVQLIVVE